MNKSLVRPFDLQRSCIDTRQQDRGGFPGNEMYLSLLIPRVYKALSLLLSSRSSIFVIGHFLRLTASEGAA